MAQYKLWAGVFEMMHVFKHWMFYATSTVINKAKEEDDIFGELLHEKCQPNK